jgi:hypothetical protein
MDSRLSKVYGHNRGSPVLDDGRRLEVRGVLGFAEEMRIRW